MSDPAAVQAWRKRTKQKLVEIAGGKCNACGYNRCSSALEFHHLDPSQKDFALSNNKTTNSLVKMIDELRKCILVCANCHREIHCGMIENEALVASQIIDEDVISKFTTEITLAKRNRLQQANDRKREIAKWKDENPHTKQTPVKVDWSQHNVFNLLEEHKSYEAVGRLLGVTGAAIKRRVKHLQSK